MNKNNYPKKIHDTLYFSLIGNTGFGALINTREMQQNFTLAALNTAKQQISHDLTTLMANRKFIRIVIFSGGDLVEGDTLEEVRLAQVSAHLRILVNKFLLRGGLDEARQVFSHFYKIFVNVHLAAVHHGQRYEKRERQSV